MPTMKRTNGMLIEVSPKGMARTLKQFYWRAEHYKFELRKGECTVAIWKDGVVEVWMRVRSLDRFLTDKKPTRHKVLIELDQDKQFKRCYNVN